MPTSPPAIDVTIDVDGCQPTFYNSLGAVHQALGDLPTAVAAYQRSIALDMDPL